MRFEERRREPPAPRRASQSSPDFPGDPSIPKIGDMGTIIPWETAAEERGRCPTSLIGEHQHLPIAAPRGLQPQSEGNPTNGSIPPKEPEETSLARFPTSGTRAQALQFKANSYGRRNQDFFEGGKEEKKEKKQTRS